MAVYRYTAVAKGREENVETGTVVARDEPEAREKLKQLSFARVSVKKLGIFSGLFKKLTADVR